MSTLKSPWLNLSKSRSLFCAAGFALALASTGHGQTIYSDTFSSGANAAAIRANAPTVDLTGATYRGSTRGSAQPAYDTSAGNPGASGFTNFNGAIAISLATGGTFTRPATPMFTISADLSVNTVTGSGGVTGPQTTVGGGGNSTRGVGLGFYSAFTDNATNQDPFASSYTGFNLQNAGGGSGMLQLVVNGVSAGFASAAVLTGTLSTTSFYNLTYTVDTSTGTLTNLVFNGVNLTSTFATSAGAAFTTAQTAFAGFGASSGTGAPAGARVDNFSVTAVPEPGTWALALVGVGMLAGVQRFRARKA